MPTPYCPTAGTALATEEGIGDLDQDAGAIALQLVCANRAAVSQIFEDAQPFFDNVVTFAALDVGDEAHAAGVMFIPRVVETLCVRLVRRLSCNIHSDTPERLRQAIDATSPPRGVVRLKPVDAETV